MPLYSTLEQDGIAEQANRHVVKLARLMLSVSTLSKTFWAHEKIHLSYGPAMHSIPLISIQLGNLIRYINDKDNYKNKDNQDEKVEGFSEDIKHSYKSTSNTEEVSTSDSYSTAGSDGQEEESRDIGFRRSTRATRRPVSFGDYEVES
ncbi:hypothetical protein QE152_g12982 [Popillia japonica]|uniref:Uncharacterized protein n=1 Tax=Popillia japonica TaxID=7064 RepID=A0AAW1LB46_POPJA